MYFVFCIRKNICIATCQLKITVNCNPKEIINCETASFFFNFILLVFSLISPTEENDLKKGKQT